ncbi:MAG: hypothetical protein H6827_09595 [Planctomycetes bacterium]|nr:hypothetical protein [Planctomycetota bacterium]
MPSAQFFVYAAAIMVVLFFMRGLFPAFRDLLRSGKDKTGIAAVKEAAEKRTEKAKTYRFLNYAMFGIFGLIVLRAISNPYWNGDEILMYSMTTMMKVLISFASVIGIVVLIGAGAAIIFFVQIYHLISPKLRAETKLRREANNESVGLLVFMHSVTALIGLSLIGAGCYVAYLLFTWSYPFSRLGAWT